MYFFWSHLQPCQKLKPVFKIVLTKNSKISRLMIYNFWQGCKWLYKKNVFQVIDFLFSTINNINCFCQATKSFDVPTMILIMQIFLCVRVIWIEKQIIQASFPACLSTEILIIWLINKNTDKIFTWLVYNLTLQNSSIFYSN